ncbi:MAG: hypothetical protein Q4G43_08830 [Mobilicoccus sp.]|nr:hypothetical protein [Mobilicoccus sp.]
MSWAYQEPHLMQVHRWHDTADGGALFHDVSCRVDLTEPWPVLLGGPGEAIALLARCWELIHHRYENTDDESAPDPPTRAPRRQNSPSASARRDHTGEVLFRKLVIASRSRQEIQRVDVKLPVEGVRHVRSHQVRPHSRRRPGELVASIPVAKHSRGGSKITTGDDRKDREGPVTVYLVEPGTG